MGMNAAGYEVPKAVPPTVDWFPSHARRWQVVTSMVRTYDMEKGAEIGVRFGRNLSEILRKCPKLHMIGVDLWDVQPNYKGVEGYDRHECWAHEHNMRKAKDMLAPFEGRVQLIQDWSWKAADQVEDESLDFFFLDADHMEDSVRKDLAAWMPKVKKGGWLMGHDISWPGVKAAVDEIVPGYFIGPDVTWMRRK
jgi:hypothetical protein